MTDRFQGWPTLNSPEDADATHRWARTCLEMWEAERAELLAEVERLRAERVELVATLEAVVRDAEAAGHMPRIQHVATLAHLKVASDEGKR